MRARTMLAVEVAAVGVAVGLALAARELAEQHYLAQGLWRTALWEAARGAVGGVYVGLAAGLALLGVIWLWQRSAGGEAARPLDEWGRRYVPFLMFLTGIAVLLSPESGGHGAGVPYRVLLPASYGVMWFALAVASATVMKRSVADQAEAWFRIRWLSAAGLGFVATFLHIWTLGFRPMYLGLFSAGALVACAVLYRVLAAPARFVNDKAGVRVARVLAGRVGRVLILLALVAGAGLGVAGTTGMSRAQAKARARGRNVILIGIDTLRADRTSLVSPTEHERDLSPHVRRLLAGRGRVFTGAIAQSSWTLPSFASMFTGLYPEQHGAEHLDSTLSASQLTLAEVLRDAGYHTMSVVSCEYLNRASGMGQGFDALDESQVLGHQAITSQQITDRAIRLLDSNGDRPFFLFAHYFDPHFCYRSHEEYPFGSWYGGWLRDAVEKMDQNAFCMAIGALGPAFAGQSRATAEDRKFLRDMYDGEIAYTESQVGRLLEYIDRKGLWDSTMVIFVGDHGEELLERNFSGHSTTLYQEQIRMPLMIAAPGVTHSVEAGPVEPRAIFATVRGFLGLSRAQRAAASPANPLPLGIGERHEERPSPVPVRSSTRPVAQAPRPGEIVVKYVWLTCVTDGRWKLIKDHLHGRAALFDLKRDPWETVDCSAVNPQRRRDLERALDELDARVSGTAAGPRTEADEEQQRRLKSLGYL